MCNMLTHKAYLCHLGLHFDILEALLHKGDERPRWYFFAIVGRLVHKTFKAKNKCAMGKACCVLLKGGFTKDDRAAQRLLCECIS